MVSTLSLEEKYNRVRRNFCFHLDIQDKGLARSLSRRLQDLGLEEVILSSRVTHLVQDGGDPERAAGGLRARCNGRTRADAMLELVRSQRAASLHPHLVRLNVQKAISLLDKLYDTFFAAPRRAHVKLFTKHYIKIEFLDKVCRPVFKEFDEWPEISIDPDPPKRDKKESTTTNNHIINDINQNQQTIGQKMTRKSRPRIKEKEEKEPKGGYCEMCNADYVDAALHRRSPHHLAFIRDRTNFLALDSLIGSGADVATFLDQATPINGERRSLRKMCNGEVEQPKSRRSKRSQSPDSTVNGNQSPKQNGTLEDDRKHNTRCSKKTSEEDRQYYKVVGVSTKLRSSGGFVVKKKESSPACNGGKPLVVKFRKVRRSELSVLSDEAEQFMFPKRASSTSSTSSDDDDEKDCKEDEKDCKEEMLSPRRKPTPQPPPVSLERRRQARPLALKEESSEEDGWPEDTRRRKRRVHHPPVKRGRRLPLKQSEPEEEPDVQIEPSVPPDEPEAEIQPDPAISPLREEPVERCMKWEEGRLRYTPAVEQLEFAFESVPKSEPWFETFRRQDQDKIATKNIPRVFALYSKLPKLPYEIGQLPPLKPNCCPLSDLVKREEKPGPSRSYGTRGMKKDRIRKRTAQLIALESHPRKSPREHASTLAILGSAGLLHRRKNGDDAKSTASEDTISDTQSTVKLEPVVSELQEASERLQQFLSEVFEDAGEYEVSEDVMEGEAALTTSANILDVSSLVSEYEDCDIIQNEIKEGVEAQAKRQNEIKESLETEEECENEIKESVNSQDKCQNEIEENVDTQEKYQNEVKESVEPRAKSRRGKFKKKNRTGWPTKKKSKKDSRTNSVESQKSLDRISNADVSNAERSSAEPPDEDSQDAISEEDPNLSEAENEKTLIQLKLEEESRLKSEVETEDVTRPRAKRKSRPSGSSTESDREDRRKKKRALAGLLLQPVVKVTRVDPAAARQLRSTGPSRPRSTRLR